MAVTLEVGPSGKRAWLTGTRTCGSARTCAYCGARTAHHRALELEAAIRGHHQAGGRVLLVTATTPHDRGMDLVWQVDRFLTATRAFKSGKGYSTLAAKIGFVGEVRGLECTFGRAGFHVHSHSLLFVAPDVDVLALESTLKPRWARKVYEAGLGRVDDDHGFRAALIGTEDQDVRRAAGYLTPTWTASDEVVRSDLKTGHGGRTPEELLADYTFDGDLEAGARFAQYAVAFRGRALLRWSSGLRARLLPEVTELSDDALSEVEPPPEPGAVRVVLGELDHFDFGLLRRFGRAGLARFLEAVEEGGLEEGWDAGQRVLWAFLKVLEPPRVGSPGEAPQAS